MPLNREWHLAHRMPPKATPEERIQWHIEHHAHCDCREIPAKLAEEIARRAATDGSGGEA